MGERTDAKRSIESSTRHLTDIAQELSRRATPRYIGEQARETALNKTQEWKDQLSSSPLALGILGGAIGALIGRSLARERRHREYRESGYGLPDLRRRTVTADAEGYRYGSESDLIGASGSGSGAGDRVQDLKNKASDRVQDLKDKASDRVQELKDKAGDVVANVRDQLPSAAEIGYKAEENPMFVALGGLALGAVAALLLPVSRKERELLDPVKQRASEAMGTLGDKLGDTVNEARDRIAGEQQPEANRGDLRSTDLPALTH